MTSSLHQVLPASGRTGTRLQDWRRSPLKAGRKAQRQGCSHRASKRATNRFRSSNNTSCSGFAGVSQVTATVPTSARTGRPGWGGVTDVFPGKSPIPVGHKVFFAPALRNRGLRPAEVGSKARKLLLPDASFSLASEIGPTRQRLPIRYRTPSSFPSLLARRTDKPWLPVATMMGLLSG